MHTYATHTDASAEHTSTYSRACTRTLVMPISGARFCNQIGIVKHLLGCEYKMDRIMGTSGGAVTAMLLLMADVASIVDKDTYIAFCCRLNTILMDIDSSWYMSHHVSWSTVLNNIVGMSRGSLYGRGTGEMFVGALEGDISKQPETWIGTFCRETAKPQLWCTKSRREADIRVCGSIYMNNNIKLTTKVAMASCAVPTFVPPVAIGNRTYIDGGVGHASPLGQCMEAFEKGIASFHVVYISPARYSSSLDPKTDELEDDDIPNLVKSSIAGMVTGIHIPDRNNGIRFVTNTGQYNKTVGIGRKALKAALDKEPSCNKSFIELAPLQEIHLDFLGIRKGDVHKSVKKSYETGFSVRHWYC